MTGSSVTTAPAPSTALVGAGAAVLAGLGAGLIAALLDARQAGPDVDGICGAALLLLQTAGWLCAVGAALCAMAWAAALAGARAAGAIGRDPSRGAAVGLAVAVAPALVHIARRLFQGGVTSRLPARPMLVAVSAAALILVAWAIARAAIRLVAACGDPGRPRWLGPAVGLGVLGIALALRWCDAHMYRRLYLYLHAALAAGTLGGLAFALRVSVLARPSPRIPRVAAAALGAALVVLAAALWLENERQAVKVAVYERTATAANAMRLLSGPRAVGEGPRPSPEARRRRYERERRSREASAGGWPVFPGAHVVLVTVDALRADRLGIYGNSARDLTPRIDSWARGRGAVFERAYCTAPHSSYSITSFHTSRYMLEEAALGRDLAHPTLAEVLAREGYETAGFFTQGIFFTEGERVSHYARSKFGFDYVSQGAPRPAKLVDNAIAEMDRIVTRGEPALFAWVHFFNVHEPYLSTRFGDGPADRYDGEIVEADREIGRLLEYLDEKLARDVVVVLAADHGEEFGDHGGHYHGSSLYEEQVRVPLIFAVPEAGPRRVSAPVSLVDLAPTILRLVGVDPPPGMAGQDLGPAIFGGDGAHVARPVFSAVMKRHMVVQGGFKLIADPSRGLYELYDLGRDPKERSNLYDGERERAEGMLEEIAAWLDDLARGEDEARFAINLGRMRDPRAVPGLLGVSRNTGAPAADRIESLRLLGRIRPWGSIEEIAGILGDEDERVATAAALALGEMGDDRGAHLLVEALYDEEPAVRDGAALTLGRLGSREAVGALVEALGRDDLKVREEAIRLLGSLRDPRATEPLIETIAEDRTRYLSVLALGKIGDPRAYDTLMDVLEHETHTDVRGYAVVALGWLGMPEAIPRLLRILEEEPEIKWTAEALARLGAVGRAPLWGVAAAPGAAGLGRGFGGCREKARVIDGEFLDRAACATKGPSAELSFAAAAPRGAEVILRARHLLEDGGERRTISIAIDGRAAGSAEIGAEAETARFPLGFGLPEGEHRAVLRMEGSGAFELDHFLLLAPAKP